MKKKRKEVPKKSSNFSIHELLDICFEQQLSGSAIDTSVQAIAHNVLVPGRCTQVFDVFKPQRLLTMMQDADDRHIYVAGGKFHFNACYRYTDRYPAVRIYHLPLVDFAAVGELAAFLDQRGIRLSPVGDEHLRALFNEEGFRERYERYKEDWARKVSVFSGLAEGRRANTRVDQTIWLESPGCIVCGGQTDEMMTSTLVAKSGLMIGMRLCKEHIAEAQRDSTALGFLARKWGISEGGLSRFKLRLHEHNEMTLQISADTVSSELNCEIVDIKDRVITARRKSGFVMKLRLHSLSNYAYNVLDPDGKNVSRIDSADDHPEVNYGPDHRHAELTRKKKNQVESSFTVGFPLADIKAIRELVELAEERYFLTDIASPK